jgi:hypothetical protein
LTNTDERHCSSAVPERSAVADDAAVHAANVSRWGELVA